MRKQTKIAAIVSAAALLALGASITSFAAVSGTWRIEDGEWKCYDRNGEPYENVFATSNGKEYYVGEDGLLVRSDWVEYDSSYYFVNSAGQKITNDWRLTTPYDDPDADEEWYYFQSSGKRADNKKITWKGNTYYFDGDGKMLTGWVTVEGANSVDEAVTFDEDADTYYCDADEGGARVKEKWLKLTAPGTEEDDADASENWYYFKSTGKVATVKQANIKGQTYFFDTEGRMLSGWVGAVNTDSDATTTYEKLYVEGEREAVITRGVSEYTDIYYCSGSDDGHAKKNRWVKTWKPADMANEDEDDLRWFWFGKDGKLYRAGDTGTIDTKFGEKYSLVDGVYELDTTATAGRVSKKKVNSKDYWFDLDGQMLYEFYLLSEPARDTDGTLIGKEFTEKMYYFGGADDGAMKTGSQSVKDDAGDTYKFYFSSKAGTRGEGITGNQSNKLYYFGRLVTANDYKYQIAVVPMVVKDTDPNTQGDQTDYVPYYFIVNNNGSIQHNKSQYKEDGDILIDARTLTESKYSGKETRYEQVVNFLSSGATKYALDLSTCKEAGGVPAQDGLFILQLGDAIYPPSELFR